MSGTSEYLRFGANSIRGYVHDQPTLIITPSTVLLPTSVTHTLPANFYDDVEPADQIVLDAVHTIHKQSITATGDFDIKAATSGKDLNLIGTQDLSITATNGEVIAGAGTNFKIVGGSSVQIGGPTIALSGITTGLTLTKTLGAPYPDSAIVANPLADTGILHYNIEATPTSGLVENTVGALPLQANVDFAKIGNIVFMHVEKTDLSKEYKCVTTGPIEFLELVPAAMRPAHNVHQAVTVYNNGAAAVNQTTSQAIIFTDGTVAIYGTATATTLGNFTAGSARGDFMGFTAVWVTVAHVAVI